MVLVAFSRSVWSRNRQRATVSGYLPVSLLVSEVVFAKQACRMPSCAVSGVQLLLSWSLIVTSTGLLRVTAVQPFV